MPSHLQTKYVGADQPVVVGGVGGGGTRVIAEILQRLGIHMGVELNKARDNLWFTLLFRRRRWLAQALKADRTQLQRALEIFQTVSLNQRALTRSEIRFVLAAVPETCWYWGIGPSLRIDKALRASTSLIRQPVSDWSLYQGWGWKEPNSQLFLPYLNEFFPEMRYIQVIRHGLDMAYSRNQYQLNYWGHLFGVDKSAIAVSLPTASLDYWIRSNEQTISYGRRELGERFMIVNLDHLCEQPAEEVTRLVSFLQRSISGDELAMLAELPRMPSTTGRYKSASLNVFRPDQLESVRSLGFEIE